MSLMENNPHPLTLLEMAFAAKKRVSLISKEFEAGFEFLMNYPKSVTIFGSTKVTPKDHFYKKAESLAARIVKELRYSIITGGGPGIMEAANKGAFEAGGQSLGLTIELPHGQTTNRYLTDKVGFHYFFSRKVCLSFCAEAYIFFPGGFGTMDEFTEILTLVQTGKILPVPIILFGIEHWTPLINFFNESLLSKNMIEKIDLSLFTLTDDEDKILEIIKNSPVQVGIDYKGDYGKNNSAESIAERPISRFLKWK